MKNVIGAILILITLFISGCNSNDTLIEEQQRELKELKDNITELEEKVEKKQRVIDENNKEYSYLNSFTEEELKDSKHFFEERDVQHLANFSPERILLLYFHSVVIDDVEAIYLLTYNDGSLPDLSAYKERYYSDTIHNKLWKTALDFRYYDSIEARDDDNAINRVIVEIGVKLGIFKSVILYGFIKEDGIWKMEILNLL